MQYNQQDLPVQQCLPLGRVWRGVLVFYACALLLNASSLHDGSQLLPFGRARRFWMQVSAPIARVAGKAGLDVPRNWLRKQLGAPLNR